MLLLCLLISSYIAPRQKEKPNKCEIDLSDVYTYFFES